MNELRPTKISEIIGQDNIKQCVKILIQSRKNGVLPHLGFFGPPGTGKTTFACAIANEINKKIYIANGGNITNTKDVLPYLTRLRRGDILFIDEIHRVSKKVQEQLYTVMEDFYYSLSKGACNINIEQFTLIGATTESGMLLRPLYDRFEHHFQLQHYTTEELSLIIQNSARKLKCVISTQASEMIARRSKFTPRIANSLLKWCDDYLKSIGKNTIEDIIVNQAMTLKQIDENGLTPDDRKYLSVLKNRNKPVSLNSISAIIGLSKNVIEHSIEPYLLQLDLIEKTNKGRVLV